MKAWFRRDPSLGIKQEEDQHVTAGHAQKEIDATKIESRDDGSMVDVARDMSPSSGEKQTESHKATGVVSATNNDSQPSRKRHKEGDFDQMSGIVQKKNRAQDYNIDDDSVHPDEASEPSVLDEEETNADEIEDEEVQELPPAGLVKDLETKSITLSQLIHEVKGIYAGLVMVEKKCIEIVNQQTQAPTKLTREQWQALIALHRTLLNEHHDFFSASHHPITVNHELRELAPRYAMPARMWRHGIHAFLELLRHRLPDSLEHMLLFIYLAYSMMGLLKETVPDFLETWIECLGDLARYRMAIEEADLRDREIWSNTARTWYNEAADLSPNTGRIQHHLAVLARPNIVQQLFLYGKALVSAVPFKNAGESILLLFNPVLEQHSASTRYNLTEVNLVCASAVVFKRKEISDFKKFSQTFESSLEGHMARYSSRFKVQGPEIAGALMAMLMDFGNAQNTFWNMFVSHQQKTKMLFCQKYGKEAEKLPKDFVVREPEIVDPIRSDYWKTVDQDINIMTTDTPSHVNFETSDEVSVHAGPVLRTTIARVTSQIGNKNIVPFMHMVFAYLHGMTYVPGASLFIEKFIPWVHMAEFLNTIGRSGVSYENVESDDFPKSFGGNGRQLPEDFVMRGLMSMNYYYPPGFFKVDNLVDEDERLLEQPSHQTPRVERCLYSAIQLTRVSKNRWLTYDESTKKFAATQFALSLQEN